MLDYVAFLVLLLGIGIGVFITSLFNSFHNAYDGTIVVDKRPDEDKIVFSLEIDCDLDKLPEMRHVLLKIQKDSDRK